MEITILDVTQRAVRLMIPQPKHMDVAAHAQTKHPFPVGYNHQVPVKTSPQRLPDPQRHQLPDHQRPLVNLFNILTT